MATWSDEDVYQRSKPIKTVMGVEIRVDPETGRFAAKVSRALMVRKNLADIEQRISMDSEPVLVVGFRYDDHYENNVIGREGAKWRLKEGGALTDSYLYLPSEAQLSELREIQQRLKDAYGAYRAVVDTCRDEREAIRKAMPRLTPELLKQAKGETSG